MLDRRKELKALYKQTALPTGIFQIKNQINGKVFIGSSTNLNAIFNRHRFQLKMKSHKNATLQKEWNQYGPEAYSFDVLETLKPEAVPSEKLAETLLALEEKWLTALKSRMMNTVTIAQKRPRRFNRETAIARWQFPVYATK